MNLQSQHENLEREDDLVPGSERGFGLLFSAIFLLIGGWGIFRGHSPGWFGVGAGLAAAATALACPQMLRVPNRLWFRLGLMLAAIVSPIALAIVFLAAIVPTGLAMRLFGKDPMRRRPDPNLESYWVVRESRDREEDSLKNQF